MLKIRFPNFKTVSRSATLLQPADTWQPIYHSAVELLEKLSLGGRFVRLIGIGVTNLCDQTVDQLSLFGDERAAQVSRLDAACDELVRRYGNGAITQARRLR